MRGAPPPLPSLLPRCPASVPCPPHAHLARQPVSAPPPCAISLGVKPASCPITAGPELQQPVGCQPPASPSLPCRRATLGAMGFFQLACWAKDTSGRAVHCGCGGPAPSVPWPVLEGQSWRLGPQGSPSWALLGFPLGLQVVSTSRATSVEVTYLLGWGHLQGYAMLISLGLRAHPRRWGSWSGQCGGVRHLGQKAEGCCIQGAHWGLGDKAWLVAWPAPTVLKSCPHPSKRLPAHVPTLPLERI